LQEHGPALAPPVALAIARGLLAHVAEGPYDTPPLRPGPGEVEIEERGGALFIRPPGPIDLPAVGALLYEMLAGGPVRRAKDPKGCAPRPLAALRAFMVGGPPLPPPLVAFVERLLEIPAAPRFADAEAALAALDELGRSCL
jgi:hypothetical protein